VRRACAETQCLPIFWSTNDDEDCLDRCDEHVVLAGHCN
jgi:hypothetical protein